MEQHTFIDRYFHSQFELMDFRFSSNRNINTLFLYLNNLQATADKLKMDFDCSIQSYPEFKVLRLLRNYFDHVGDIDELRISVSIDKDIIFSHSEHILIPLEVFAKSVQAFIKKNTLKESNRNYQKKQDYIKKELESISECFDGCVDLVNDLTIFCNKPRLKLDGKVYELGFDMYKFIYNITNIIADKCFNIECLSQKKTIQDLDASYSITNNIEKFNMQCHPNNVPIMTTEGFIFADKYERV